MDGNAGNEIRCRCGYIKTSSFGISSIKLKIILNHLVLLPKELPTAPITTTIPKMRRQPNITTPNPKPRGRSTASNSCPPAESKCISDLTLYPAPHPYMQKNLQSPRGSISISIPIPRLSLGYISVLNRSSNPELTHL